MKSLKVPVIETQRLIIRPITLEDAQDLYEISSNPNVTKYLTYNAHKDLEESKYVIENIFLKRVEQGIFEPYVVVYKENNKMIGTCDFINYDGHTVEIGYMYHEDYWGKGIASEALQSVIHVAFNQLNIGRISISHMIDNKASQRVIEKAGFKRIGIERQSLKTLKGTIEDVVVYDLLKEDIDE